MTLHQYASLESFKNQIHFFTTLEYFTRNTFQQHLGLFHGISVLCNCFSINNKSFLLQNLIAKEAQDFWLEWVELTYPELETQAYFVPATHINRVPLTKIPDADVHVLDRNSTTVDSPNVQETDMAIDAAVGRVVFSLHKMAETHKDEVFMAISQLSFGDYLGEPCYMSVAALFPHPYNLPETLPSNWRQGSFDLLIIHRHYGIIVCEIKALGDSEQTSSEAESDSSRIGDKLRRSVSQLDKAEAMLSYLVSDVAPGLSITKTIALPNLTSGKVQQVMSADPELAQVRIKEQQW